MTEGALTITQRAYNLIREQHDAVPGDDEYAKGYRAGLAHALGILGSLDEDASGGWNPVPGRTYAPE